VLINEALSFLQVVPNTWYIDATAGGGGHTQEILRCGGNVLAIDQDEEAVKYLKEKFASELEIGKIKIENENYSQIEKLVEKNKLSNINGVLFDLGTSRFQIKASGRGFSFNEHAPLDMRMSQKTSVTAKELVNTYGEVELEECIKRFGEERLAQDIAEKIVEERRQKPIEFSDELATLISEVYKAHGIKTKNHPATKTFQALRIAVNEELTHLKKGIAAGFNVLEPGGRCIVISFHSLEDRIVKLTFTKLIRTNVAEVLTKKPIVATRAEVRANRLSRSAKLRAIKKRYI
jgi:16S rRNA (cytosine1402-N4)-methyltransferase